MRVPFANDLARVNENNKIDNGNAHTSCIIGHTIAGFTIGHTPWWSPFPQPELRSRRVHWQDPLPGRWPLENPWAELSSSEFCKLSHYASLSISNQHLPSPTIIKHHFATILPSSTLNWTLLTIGLITIIRLHELNHYTSFSIIEHILCCNEHGAVLAKHVNVSDDSVIGHVDRWFLGKTLTCLLTAQPPEHT